MIAYRVTLLYIIQPMIYGRGPMPSRMHMVPMVLPDGRIGCPISGHLEFIFEICILTPLHESVGETRFDIETDVW